MLDTDCRVRVVCTRHERIGRASGRSAKRLLLGLEVVVEQLLVEELLGGELLGELVVVEGVGG